MNNKIEYIKDCILYYYIISIMNKCNLTSFKRQHCCNEIKKCQSTKIINFTEILRPYAVDSELQQNHVAALIDTRNNNIVSISCNVHVNRICGCTVPSGHAEACVLNYLYGRRRRFKGRCERCQ